MNAKEAHDLLSKIMRDFSMFESWYNLLDDTDYDNLQDVLLDAEEYLSSNY